MEAIMEFFKYIHKFISSDLTSNIMNVACTDVTLKNSRLYIKCLKLCFQIVKFQRKSLKNLQNLQEYSKNTKICMIDFVVQAYKACLLYYSIFKTCLRCFFLSNNPKFLCKSRQFALFILEIVCSHVMQFVSKKQFFLFFSS